MRNRLSVLFVGLVLAVQTGAASAASVTLQPKIRPVVPVLLLDTGAVGRVCLISPTDGKLDNSTCVPFAIPQDSVMGTPIEVSPPTTKSRAWISQGDPAAFPHLVYVVYGWKAARSIPIRANIPQGFALGRKSFGKTGEGLQFVPNAKGGGLVLTTEEQLASMQKFRAALRVAVITALKDIGMVTHKNTRVAYDCGDPLDNPALTVGTKPANVDCGDDWGSDPGALAGGGFNGAGGGLDGGFGNWGVPSAPWSLESFDDFADDMVHQDFSAFMADFVATQRDKMPKCAAFIQNCHDGCNLMEKIEGSGCATLGVAAGFFLSPSIGAVVTFYCGTKIEVATAQCNATCNTPTQFQCQN